MSGTRHTAGARAFDVVVVAASYGGLAASRVVFEPLPETFPVPILLVQHRDPRADLIAPILAQCTNLSVSAVHEGARPAAGCLYVLPPDRQTVLDANGAFVFDDAHRSAADPLLQSVASVHGARAIAVVLTGLREDASAGVRAIKRRGGRVLAQDQESSAAFAMPRAAIATGCSTSYCHFGTSPPRWSPSRWCRAQPTCSACACSLGLRLRSGD